MIETKLIIECICGSHLVLIREELLDGEIVYTLTLYNQGVYHPKPKFWHKLKVIWNYIRYNHLFDDQIVIRPEDLKSIHDLIGKYLNDKRAKDITGN